jgi:hypothetical protein
VRLLRVRNCCIAELRRIGANWQFVIAPSSPSQEELHEHRHHRG